MIGYLSKNKKRKKKKAILINCLPGIEIGNKEEIKAGQSIFRIINHIQASKILEIGTFFGIDTLYMIESNNLANCISLCDNPEMEILARDVFEKQKKPEIKMFAENHMEDLKKSLAILNKVDFVLFNASSDYEQRLDDFKSCLSVIHSGTVFVMKYIHNSPEMEKIWNIAKNHNEVTASIDLYYIGILLFRQDVEKRNYIISQKKIKNENLH